MLRVLFFAIMLLSCQSAKIHQEPIATFYGKVVFLDKDPLCRLRNDKTHEARLEDILRNSMWSESYVEIPYRREEKATTSVRCVY